MQKIYNYSRRLTPRVDLGLILFCQKKKNRKQYATLRRLNGNGPSVGFQEGEILERQKKKGKPLDREKSRGVEERKRVSEQKTEGVVAKRPVCK